MHVEPSTVQNLELLYKLENKNRLHLLGQNIAHATKAQELYCMCRLLRSTVASDGILPAHEIARSHRVYSLHHSLPEY